MIPQKYIFSIKHDNGTFFLETVASSKEMAERMIMNAEFCPLNSLTLHSVEPLYDIKQIKNASNGSARFVVHYLDFLTTKEKETFFHDRMKSMAKYRANRLGFRAYKYEGMYSFFVISTCLSKKQIYEAIEKEKQKQ